MLKSGLVSVSFRGLAPEEVAKVAVASQLEGIEWGGDVHVPPGDLERAKQVRAITERAGLKTFAYGSYYQAGENENPKQDFLPYLQAAEVLGAPSIRVWAGTKWSWRADESYVKRVVEDTKIICDMAKERHMKICYEYHGWTLTDNRFSAVDTVKLAERDNLYLYWQPNFALTEEENRLALKMVLPYLDHVHVFYWDANEARFPLSQGQTLWKSFIDMIKKDGKDHGLMLEFLKDDSTQQCINDALTLNSLLMIV